MTARDSVTPQVLVAGSGPVGLTVAHELTRRGVRVRLVDKAPGPAETSRATAVHARTMEVFHQMGVLDRLLPRGQRVRHFSMHRNGRRLVRFDTNYDKLSTRFPFSLMVGQVVTEEILRDALKDLGVEPEWGVALEGFEQEGDGVTAALSHADGTRETVSVPWLVGTDGAHSVARATLGLRLLGESSETWLNADIEIEPDLQRDSNHLLHTGNGTILMIPFPEPGKWRAVDTVDTDGAEDWEHIRARMERKISYALRRPVKVSPPSWVSRFTAQQRMIQRMNVNRVFLAGDAAHVHSPASGQGMNTGIQDAYNLGWKLADVANGYADRRLLESYGAERVPIGERLLKTTKTATGLVALRNIALPVVLPVGMFVLNTAKPLKRRIEGKIMRGISGLALEYPATPLVLDSSPRSLVRPGARVGCDGPTERNEAGWRALCAEEFPDPRWTLLAFPDGSASQEAAVRDAESRFGGAVSVRTVCRDTRTETGARPLADPGGALARHFDASPGEFVLVRPDGYLAGKARLGVRDVEAALGKVHLTPAGQSRAD
ncbi:MULTISPECIES: FAD-dependent oxidoreductase [unclassified Nocardiopsis]|uniref:FAD-dependent oxidoreductase n=1 Tax=Nocardiopsis TaxID=2013 RepID=UPI00387A8CAF